VSVLQAALIALFYAFARSSFNLGLGRYVFAQPLVAGTIVGAILGDPLRGAQIGGALNLSTLALTQLRLVTGPDVALVGYVGVPLMLLAGLRAESSDTAALFGALLVFGITLNFLRGLFNTLVAHWADFFADQGNITVVSYLNWVPTQIFLVLTSFITAFAVLLFDARSIIFFATTIPFWLQDAMTLAQYLLAALGIAMSLKLVMQGSSVAYFLLGWLTAPHLGIVPATLLGGSVALIHAFLARKRVDTNANALVQDVMPSEQASAYNEQRRLSAYELQSSFLLWAFFHDAATNFERGQNLGFVQALGPVLNRLQTSLEERIAMLRRHLMLHTTEWTLGAALVGSIAALEERRANGEVISDAELVGAKTGLMASLDAIGTVLMLSGLTSLLVAVGADLARRGSLLGPFIFILVTALTVVGVGFGSFWLGYGQTHRAVDWARFSQWLRPALFGAMRLGAFVLGALIVVLVPMRLPDTAVLQIGDATWALQPRVLDAALPGLVPLGITLAFWWLLRFKRANPMLLMGMCLLAALVIGAIGRLLGWV
jgi:mannose/fructose/N-acetylgalactosamine-specific phosphotransferase system component IID/mannose/fructose/N-acetylgalactosamine-specific phosphotransferase system component IIC